MELVTNILLGILILLFVAAGVVSWLFIRKIASTVENFILPAGKDLPSPLANSVDAVSIMFARAMSAQIKATLMGVQSGVSRAEGAVKGDIVEDLTSASPLGGILGNFPALKKTLKRNPALLDLAMQFMQSRMGGFGAGGSTPPPGNGNNGNQVKFNL